MYSGQDELVNPSISDDSHLHILQLLGYEVYSTDNLCVLYHDCRVSYKQYVKDNTILKSLTLISTHMCMFAS